MEERYAGEWALFLTYEEKALLLSVLEGDTQGTWGDERSERIKRLISKVKREKVSA